MDEDDASEGDQNMSDGEGDQEVTPTESNEDMISPQPGEITELVAVDDRTVGVRFWNGAEPCARARVAVSESADAVEVVLETGLHPNAAAMSCIAQTFYYEIRVGLAEPVGDRELVDATPAPAAGGSGQAAGPGDEAEFSTEQYLGLPLAEAAALAEQEGRDFRIGRQDGEQFMLTTDYVPSRVTVEVDDGIVTNAIGG